ncbi:MAG: bifunctional methionine sulfoxide reductase B/A protein [Gammaproteobacteria bacterium]|nr:bifunctional methionine sulfoxide reductase B/A protein [Gammaproteobacteria bacterium]
MDKIKSLTPFVNAVACQKATEHPFSGRFLKPEPVGTFLCRRCGIPLWESSHQFPSHCGWPSFDDRNPNAILEVPDSDGMRTEIICARCQSHLGHVFRGEGFTKKNQRDCVNSVMLDFIPFVHIQDTQEIILAGGCFWGVEYWFKKQPGVLLTECGYIGGHVDNPDYDTICQGNTGHYEAVRIIFNPAQIDTKTLYKLFFEIHNPAQHFGQGPDIGHQYQSAIFCFNEEQTHLAQELILELKKNDIIATTKILSMQTFWPAESYHQDYYTKHQKAPYCHIYTKRF